MNNNKNVFLVLFFLVFNLYLPAFQPNPNNNQNKFILITSLYNETNLERLQEYITCLEKNINHPSIEKIHVVYDTSKDDDKNQLLFFLKNKNVVISYANERPTYEYCFNLANDVYPEKRIILTNADIYFNDSLNQLADFNFDNAFLALTRWNVTKDNSLEPHKHDSKPATSSQDTWIFETPLKKFKSNIAIGTPHCDGRIAFEAQKIGLWVINPCKTIQCCHLHLSNIRNYVFIPYNQTIGPIKFLPWITLPKNNRSKFKTVISYLLNDGRFGNNILTYAKCKWLSFKYSIPLLYADFMYSKYLNIHNSEFKVDGFKKGFKSQKNIIEEKMLHQSNKENTLFNTFFATKIEPVKEEVAFEDHDSHKIYTYSVTYEIFGNELKKMLEPIKPKIEVNIPEDVISLALHVRKGGGYDHVTKNLEPVDYSKPAKFPPDSYYIQQIQIISEALGNPMIFIHVFTDDPNPADLVKNYQTILQLPNLIWSYRKEGNAHNKNVIEDYYTMAQFDILIRPLSYFSWASQLIGNHKIIMFPIHAFWEKDQKIIDDVKIVINNDSELYEFESKGNKEKSISFIQKHQSLK